MVSRKPRSTPRRNAATRETHTMATANQRNKRAVLARFPAPPLRIVKAGMRRNLDAVALPSQSDSAKHRPWWQPKVVPLPAELVGNDDHGRPKASSRTGRFVHVAPRAQVGMRGVT